MATYGPTTLAKAAACEALAVQYGLKAIPWAQIIQMILSLLTTCIPVAAAVDHLNHPDALDELAMMRIARRNCSNRQEAKAVVLVLKRQGATVTAEEATALVGECTGPKA